jgi:hypothetical protein
MIPVVNVEIALTVDLDKPKEEETIITDIEERIKYLEGVEQFEINLTGSNEEDERISAYNESLKELESWYGVYKEAVEVA